MKSIISFCVYNPPSELDKVRKKKGSQKSEDIAKEHKTR